MNKVLKKIAPYLRIQWMIGFSVLASFCGFLSLFSLIVYKNKLSEVQMMIWLCGSHLLAIITFMIFALLFVIFRKQVNYLFQTIKSIANGEFIIATEQKEDEDYGEAYQDLSRVVEELKSSKEEMEQFTNEFLHEIKTPLTAIHGFAELLMETGKDVETEDRMKYLQIISDESIRLSELSQNTLLLAKMDACQIVTDKEFYNLSEQIKHCVILFLTQADQKNIQLSVDVENLMFYGNKEFMEQVWINLISNAIKFTPKGGKIQIEGISDEKGITVYMKDNGCGMDEETQLHIFEKFYQGKTGRQKGGNGIGLSIVHRIIALCKGSIEVSSALDEGTTFRVFLPKDEK